MVIVLAATTGCRDNSDADEAQPDDSRDLQDSRTSQSHDQSEKTIITMATYRESSRLREQRHYEALLKQWETENPDPQVHPNAPNPFAFFVPNPDFQQIADAVAEFNKENLDYYIELTDYSEFNTEGGANAGLMRLATEINSGVIPDIIEVAELPFKQWVARGLFTDLYPFIDSDLTYSRDDFMQSVLRAAEIDGGLYQIFPSFILSAIMGDSAVIGTDIGWDMGEFAAVFDAHPELYEEFGFLSNIRFLRLVLESSIDEYIDWVAGTAHFDGTDFMQLLELSSRFPDESFFEILGSTTITYYPPDYVPQIPERIMWPYDLNLDILWDKGIFGGEIVLKAYPNEYKSGPTIGVAYGFAIAETSVHKEAAWEFLRTFLDKDTQLTEISDDISIPVWRGIPINQAAFDVRVNELLTEDISEELEQQGIHPIPPTQDDVDLLLTFIDTVSYVAGHALDETMWDIISEDAMDYFNGLKSAETATAAIQSRVSILVSERS